MKPKYQSTTPRCTNAMLKVDVQDLPKNMTLKQLDRIPRDLCSRPLLPIYGEDGLTVVAQYCANCDGPLHRYERGPEAVKKYYDARRRHPGLR